MAKKPPGRPPHDDVLTLAEWRVADAVRHGLTNPAIAERLHISVDAVKFHVSNVLTKLGLAKRTELMLWDGLRRDSLRSSRGASAGGFTGGIGQVARSVADIDTSVVWYRDVLGLAHLYTFGNLAFFDCEGTRLMLSAGDGEANSIIYFRVGDIGAAHRDLAARGVTFIAAPHRIHRHEDGTEEWMAFLEDNEGRPLAIMSIVTAGKPEN